MIQVVGGYSTIDEAGRVWGRIHNKDPSILEHVGEPMKINGRGNAKHCADAQTMVEILIMVPSNSHTRAYRRRCSEIIARYQSGDQSLKAEIDRNKAAAEANGGLPQFQSVPAGNQELPLVNDERCLQHSALALSLRERTLVLDLASTPEGIRRYHAEEDRALAERIATDHENVLASQERILSGQERVRQLFVSNVTTEMALFDQYKVLLGSDVILYKAAISNFNPTARLAITSGAAAEAPSQDGSRTTEKGKSWDVALILSQLCGQGTKRASEMASYGGFGRDVKAMYIAKYNREPEVALRVYANGKLGDAAVYSPVDVNTWIVQELTRLIAERPDAGVPKPGAYKGRKRKGTAGP
jgi:hypothetical protein